MRNMKKEMKYERFTFEKSFSATIANCNFQKPFTSICAIFANNKCQNYSNLKFNFSCISLPFYFQFSLFFHFCFWIFYELNFFIGCCELLSKKLKLFAKWIKRQNRKNGREKLYTPFISEKTTWINLLFFIVFTKQIYFHPIIPKFFGEINSHSYDYVVRKSSFLFGFLTSNSNNRFLPFHQFFFASTRKRKKLFENFHTSFHIQSCV